MRGVLRGRVQRTLDHLSYLRVRYCSWPTRTIFVSQPFNAILHEPAAPFADRVFVDTKAFGDFLALQSLRTEQNHPATIRQRTWRFVSANLSFEKSPILDTQHDQICLPARHHITPCMVYKGFYNEAYFSSR